jgi:hypothetical protein
MSRRNDFGELHRVSILAFDGLLPKEKLILLKSLI